MERDLETEVENPTFYFTIVWNSLKNKEVELGKGWILIFQLGEKFCSICLFFPTKIANEWFTSNVQHSKCPQFQCWQWHHERVTNQTPKHKEATNTEDRFVEVTIFKSFSISKSLCYFGGKARKAQLSS